MNDSAEQSIWYLFVEGDTKAFSTLFKTYYHQLHNYGLRISSDRRITEDCLQSFFIYLYNHRNQFGAVQQVRSYLFVSFRRAIFKSMKQERRYIKNEELLKPESSFEFSPEELNIKQEFARIQTAALASLLNKLSVRQREVIYLKYYSGLKTNEITEVMDISYQSVQNTLQKAFTKLRSAAESQEILRVLHY